MRKVTKQAREAFNQGKPFSKDNTAVIVTDNEVSLTLHGNKIMWWHKADPTHLHFSMCGWPSVTTRERLNGMLPHPWGIVQKRGQQVLMCRNRVQKVLDPNQTYTLNPLFVR